MPESSQRSDVNFEKMCRHGVDLSQGQLVDINLECFASDKLLVYIAERSEKLRRLRLARCDSLSGYGLIKAIKRFPNLEELHIILSPQSNIYHQNVEGIVETIGDSCPLLRSFSLNRKSDYYLHVHWSSCDEVAYAIARSMPELRHLQLPGNNLTNDGLKAILDGCPHLKSLDLHRCYHVKLHKGDLKKRCSSQIKYLRWEGYGLPNLPRMLM